MWLTNLNRHLNGTSNPRSALSSQTPPAAKSQIRQGQDKRIPRKEKGKLSS